MLEIMYLYIIGEMQKKFRYWLKITISKQYLIINPLYGMNMANTMILVSQE